MAKKKRSKSSTHSKNKVSIEFIGLILILIGVIGIGVFGPVGNIIKQFAIFLVGTYSNLLILFLKSSKSLTLITPGAISKFLLYPVLIR